MAEKQISRVITFLDEAALQREIVIELDDVYNVDDQGEAKSAFRPDGADPAYIRVYRFDTENDYQMFSSYGDLGRSATSVPYNLVETLYFPLSDEEELDRVPEGAVEYEWIGNEPVGEDGLPLFPVFDGKKAKVSEEIVGILQCTYKYLADRWILRSDLEGEVLVVALQEIDSDTILKESLVVEFVSEVQEFEDVTLEVRDYCTGDSLPGCEVFLDELSQGNTDSSGQIDLGELVVGQTYQLRVVKSGYIDSDEDDLLNDEFTVESAS